MHLFYQPEISLGHLSQEESRHAIKVLRLVSGNEIDLTDGRGTFYKARIKEPNQRKCEFEIISTSPQPKRNFTIHLAIAPTKNSDRMEWMVEKCVEIGVEQISFVHCTTSERKTINLERLEKVVVSALKQSHQAWLPVLNSMIPFEKFLANRIEKQKFICYVDEKNLNYLAHAASTKQDYVILIGPEGDFTKDELDVANLAGFQKVSLGHTRLRTETAGLTAVMTINLLNQGP